LAATTIQDREAEARQPSDARLGAVDSIESEVSLVRAQEKIRKILHVAMPKKTGSRHSAAAGLDAVSPGS
jgi:hypothetical protein